MNERDTAHSTDDLRRRVELLEHAICTPTTCDNECSNETDLRANALARRHYEITRNDFGPFRSSIDDNRNDNGYLLCMLNRHRGVVNIRYHLHSSTSRAFMNLRGGSEEESWLVGHGDQGLISTGDGQTASNPDKYMSMSNRSRWNDFAGRGITGSHFDLFGCKVGGGTAGARFLQAVSNLTRTTVGAWTGDTWCNSQRFWGTGTYVTARPGRRLQAVESPEMYTGADEMKTLRLRSPDGFDEVAVDSIESVNYTPIGIFAQEFQAINAEKADVSALLSQIDFTNPLVTTDKPGAILVGQLVITYGTDRGDRFCRTLRVLGYSLLQDTCFPDTYYHASSALRKELQSAR